MHPFDIVAGCAALLFIILGIKRGFVEEVVRVLAVMCAFFGSLSLYRKGAVYLEWVHLSGSVRSVISFLVIFLAILVAVTLIGILIKKIVHLTVLGWVDRLCGGVLGFVKVFFLVWIIVMAVSSLPIEGLKRWFSPSKSYSFLMAISPVLRAQGLVPGRGPVQNILKANPIPAISKSIEDAASKGSSALRTNHEPAAKKLSLPSSSVR